MRSWVCSTRALSPVFFPRLQLDVRHGGAEVAQRGLCCSPRSSAAGVERSSMPLPSQARVVICGGGIVGTSVAYHLAKLGWTGVVLLEQGR